MGFKENLKAELQYNGMLVKELAYKTGINKQTIDNYLSSHNAMPSADAAVKIAKALNTTVEYLITGKKEYKNIESNDSDVCDFLVKYGKLSPDKKELVSKLIDSL